MKQVTLPDGHIVPALGQGTWYMGDDRSKRSEEIATLRRGIELGMTLVDTAEMYGGGRSEQLVGEAIKDVRDQVFLVDKVLPSNASSKGTITACERSLRNLQTDHIDLYLLHWSGSYRYEETFKAFETLKQQGKIARWGVSNMDPGEMDEILATPQGDQCMVNQVLYNLTRRGIEFDLLPMCREDGIPLMAYSPVEQSRLLRHKGVKDIAAKLGITAAQLALAWVLRQEDVIAIPKASRVAHVEDNFGAADLELSPETLKELDHLFPAPTRSRPLEIL